ncbi:MAG: hypothetical protein KJ749_15325 [Planctomycetes bacterium]|nr:hypothetical protein [Planctomycetota bacterium]
MSDMTILAVLYAVAVLMLIAEIFIPSHGVLSVAGIGFLVAAVAKTFTYGGRAAGVVAVLACLVFVPAFAFVAIKYWHRTPIGRLIAPPNPVRTASDTSVPVDELRALLGQRGRTLSPLRPVGIGEFNGKRISCVAEHGMIEVNVEIEGTGIKGANLVVMERKA